MAQNYGPYAPKPIPETQPFKPNTGVEQQPRGFKTPSQNPKKEQDYSTSKETIQDAGKLAKIVGAAKAAKSGFDRMVSDIHSSKDWKAPSGS